MNLHPLSGKKQKAIVLLVAGKNIETAAQCLEINGSTLYRWRQQQDFKDALFRAKTQVMGEAISLLQNGAANAIKALTDIMKDKKAPPANRVTAARSIIEFSLKGHEIETITKRLDEIEERLKLNEGGQDTWAQ